MVDIAGLSVSVDVNFGELTGQMEAARKATQELTKELQSTVNQISEVSKSLQQAGTQAATSLQKSAEIVSQLNTTTTRATKELAAGVKAAGAELNKAATTSASSVQKLAASVERAEAAISKVGQTAQQSGQNVTRFAQSAAAGMQTMGAASAQAAQTTGQGAQQVQQNMQQVGAVSESASKRMEDSLNKASKSLQDAVKALNGSLGTLQVTLDQTKRELKGAGDAASQTSNGLVQMTKKQQDVVSGSANLGRFMRVLTTNIFGVNAAAIAVGTALGNLATQLVSRVVLSLIQAGTQFSTLNNRLAESRFAIQNLSGEFQFIDEQARLMGVSTQEMTDRWLQLAEGAHNAGTDVERVREAFVRMNETQAKFKVDTFASGWDRFTAALGRFVTNLDQALGISQGIIWLLDKMSTFLEWMAENAPRAVDPLTKMKNQAVEAQIELQKIRKEMDSVIAQAKIPGTHEEQRNKAFQKYLGLLKEEGAFKRALEQLNRAIAEEEARIREISGEQRAEIDRIIKSTQEQLKQEVVINGLRGAEQEKMIKLLQIETQLRAANLGLTEEQLKAEAARLLPDIEASVSSRVGAAARDANRAFQAQQASDILLQQTGLIENAILTYDDYATAVENAEQRIREAHAYSYEAEIEITKLRMQEQRNFQNAIMDTAQMAGQAIASLFPKSKAAAIAEAVINTAVGITKALRDVPWPLNWVQAGLIAASGAAQIAAIRSANPGGGGSAPRPGGSRGITPVEQRDPGRAIQINMRRGDIWSSDAVAELIERINDEVSNGRTLVSTRTVPI